MPRVAGVTLRLATASSQARKPKPPARPGFLTRGRGAGHTAWAMTAHVLPAGRRWWWRHSSTEWALDVAA